MPQKKKLNATMPSRSSARISATNASNRTIKDSDSSSSENIAPNSSTHSPERRSKRIKIEENLDKHFTKPSNQVNETKSSVYEEKKEMLKINSEVVRRKSVRSPKKDHNENFDFEDDLSYKNKTKRIKIGDDLQNSHNTTQSLVKNDGLGDWPDWPLSFSDVNSPLLSRLWFESSQANVSFSIMTYNILSESLLKNSHHFSKLNPLHWNRCYRHEILIKELSQFLPTIICMQEVDKDYFFQLQNSLKSLNFNCHFNTNIGKNHGLMLAFNESCFKLVHFESFVPSLRSLDRYPITGSSEFLIAIRDYLNVSEIVQVCILEDLNSQEKKYLCVVNIQITPAHHIKLDLCCIQAIESLWRISEMCSKFKPRPSWVLCGDFNSTPDSILYEIVRDGYPNDTVIEKLQQQLQIHKLGEKKSEDDCGECLVNLMWPAFQHPIVDVSSSYRKVVGREPPLTGHAENNTGCLDYIWSSSEGIEPVKVLLPPSEYLHDRNDSLPNSHLPSNHVSLVSCFAWL